MIEQKHSKDLHFFRIGAVCILVGSLLAMVGNLIHPPTTGQTHEGVANIIAQSSLWTPIHMTIVAGLVLMLLGLVALCRSIRNGLAGTFADFACVSIIAGVTIGLLLVTLDGLAAKQLADAWAVAPVDEKVAALSVVTAQETLNFAMAALFNILFAGVAYILLGLAVVFSGVYKSWLGWIAVGAGIGSIIAGGIQSVTGESTGLTHILTILFPTIITIWTAIMGVMLYRKAPMLAQQGSKELHND